MAKILIVDDEVSLRFTFRSFLTGKNHEVTTAEDYPAAMTCLDETVPDLIFVDILLPGGKTGLDILGEVRKRGIQAPVIVITGQPGVETAADAVRQGAFDYVPKPVRKQTLLQLTATALKFNALEKEKNRIEEEKERYRNHLEAVFRSVSEAIVTVDMEMRITSANDALERLCGTPFESLGGTYLGKAPCDCLTRCHEQLRQTLASGEPVQGLHVECRHVKQANQTVVVNSSPLKGEDGTPTGMVVVIRDITRIRNLEQSLKERYRFHNIVGKSPAMRKIYDLLENLAHIDTTILITGESGTGKELIANALHYSSSRSDGPMVRVNCSALSENLLESELFGHVKGAFTGAVKDRKGRFEKASGGTLFLDEIGDLSPAVQAKLLRVLQEKEIERVGESTPVKVDVRLVTATHRNLSRAIKEGSFRQDLYYRLKVMEISPPPLRERREDIPLLVDHFLQLFNSRLKRDVEELSGDALRLCMTHPWPGNVRELRHALEHAFILCRDRIITTEHLPEELRAPASAPVPAATTPHAQAPAPESGELPAPAEKILSALKQAGGNKARAARILGIHRQTLYRRIARYRISIPEQD